jgi:SAM-dependent methyltransferase
MTAGRLSDTRKQSVRDFWDATPCGTVGVSQPDGSAGFFEEIERRRYELEAFIARYARFPKWSGKRVLEIGCGTGTDLLQFLRAGAEACGLDLSPRSAALARKRIGLYGFDGDRVFIGDAENLPFRRDCFDLVYSWGVLHHTPDTVKAVGEVLRVLCPGGECCIMLYHRRSLVSLQFYLRFGLLAGRPFRSLDDIMAAHQESPGTKVYTRSRIRSLFSGFRQVQIRTVLTPYDLPAWRGRFLPAPLRRLVPDSLGYFLVVQGRKG